MRGNIAWLTVWFLGTLAINYAQLIARFTDSLPGEPGKDFPIHAEIPKTSFSCQKQPFPGYYADVDSGCQAYHLCGDNGNQTSFLCPNGTIFNQETQTCDEWYKVDCDKSPQLFWRNKYFNAESERSKNTKKRASIVGDDDNTNGLKGNNSSSVLSDNDELLKWKKIQELIDSEITKVLYRKQFENVNSNSSPDIETSFKNLREALSNGNSTQFKKSLDGVISSRIDALSGSIRLNKVGKDPAPIDELQPEKMDAQKKAKAAETIFTLLNYVDKIKTTLTSPKSSKTGTKGGKTKSEILPRFGEKLFKMISTLEKKQSPSTNTKASDNSNSRFNIADDVDFFDGYKYFVNNKEINKDEDNVSINESMPLSLNASTFEKDSNNSIKTELDFLGNETSIAMIQRILDLAKQNLHSTTDANVENISKSVNTSEVQDVADTNVSSLVDDSTHGNHLYHKSINDIISSIEISGNNSKSPNDVINSTKEIDKAAITIYNSSETSSSIHDSGETSSSIHDSGETSSSIHDSGEISSSIHDSGETSSSIHDSGEIPSSIHDSGETSSSSHNSSETSSLIHDSGEISSSIHDSGETLSAVHNPGDTSSSIHNSGETLNSKDGYEDDLSETYDYDEYSDEYVDDLPNKINTSVENESSVDSSQEDTTNVDAFGEDVNNTKSDDEKASIVENLGQNISFAKNEEGSHDNDSFDSNLSNGDRIDDNLNQNSNSSQDVNNERNINKTRAFYDKLMRVLTSQENVNHTIVLGDNKTNIITNETGTNKNNVSEANVDKEDSLVDKTESNDLDENINHTTGENNKNLTDTTIGLAKEGLDVALDKSEVNVNTTETVMAGDDDDSEEGSDELLGILKGIYSTIDQEELYSLRR